MNVGVVNLGRLLGESKRGKSLSARLRAVGERWEQQIGAVETKLAELRTHLGSSDGAAAEVLFKLRRDARLCELELASLRDRMQFEVDVSREHFRTLLLSELEPMLKALAKERGLQLVLTEQGGVAHVEAALDLTDELCRRLDTYSK